MPINLKSCDNNEYKRRGCHNNSKSYNILFYKMFISSSCVALIREKDPSAPKHKLHLKTMTHKTQNPTEIDY